MSLQFLTNAAGEPTAVLVPIREWEKLQQQLQHTRAPRAAKAASKEQLKEEFREALREMQAGEGRPASTLLAELDALSGQNH